MKYYSGDNNEGKEILFCHFGMGFFISIGAEEAQSPSKSKGNKKQVFTVSFSFNDVACFHMGSLEEYHWVINRIKCARCSQKFTRFLLLLSSLSLLLSLLLLLLLLVYYEIPGTHLCKLVKKGNSYADSTICEECLP